MSMVPTLRVCRSSARLSRVGAVRPKRVHTTVVVQAKSKGDGKDGVLVFEPMKEVSGMLQTVEKAHGNISLARQSYEKSLEDAINDQVRAACSWCCARLESSRLGPIMTGPDS